MTLTIIILGLNSFLLLIFSIWIIIRLIKSRYLTSKLNELNYWITSIDKDELTRISPHDARYLTESKKILKEILDVV